MATLVLRLFLVVVLAGGVVRPATAQTARIAHFSHSGSAEMLDAAVDNFGSVGVLDSIVLTSDSTALKYTHGVPGFRKECQPIKYTKADNPQPGVQTLQQLRRYGDAVKTAGVDTVSRKKDEQPVQPVRKTKRKKSAFLPAAAPAPPQHPGVALAVAAILTLSGAGWLLGERPRPVAGSAA